MYKHVSLQQPPKVFPEQNKSFEIHAYALRHLCSSSPRQTLAHNVSFSLLQSLPDGFNVHLLNNRTNNKNLYNRFRHCGLHIRVASDYGLESRQTCVSGYWEALS